MNVIHTNFKVGDRVVTLPRADALIDGLSGRYGTVLAMRSPGAIVGVLSVRFDSDARPKPIWHVYLRPLNIVEQVGEVVL